MLVLVIVGFTAGVITSISPCVLPVLPVVLTATADQRGTRGRLRPYGVGAGLVASFCVSVRFGSLVLGALHLPQNLLRGAGIAVLVVIGVSLLVPRVADLLQRPFEKLPQRQVNPDGNGV